MAIAINIFKDDLYISEMPLDEGAASLERVINWVHLPITVLGSIFNIIVIKLSLALYTRFLDSTYLFVISMASADLLFTAIPYPYYILAFNLGTIEKQIHCIMLYSFIYLSSPCSAFSLTLLNMDKLIYFHWPLKYVRWLSKTRSIVFIFISWTVCIINIICLHAFKWVEFLDPYQDNDTDSCHYFKNSTCVPCDHVIVNMNWYHIYMILFCLLPVLSSCIVSLYLMEIVRKRKKSSAEVNQTQQNAYSSRQFQRTLKAFIFIFTTSVWTTIAYIPGRIFFLFKFDLGINNQYAELVFIRLLYLNAIINPCITLTVHTYYRKECYKHVIRLKKWICHQLESEQDQSMQMKQLKSNNHLLSTNNDIAEDT